MTFAKDLLGQFGIKEIADWVYDIRVYKSKDEVSGRQQADLWRNAFDPLALKNYFSTVWRTSDMSKSEDMNDQRLFHSLLIPKNSQNDLRAVSVAKRKLAEQPNPSQCFALIAHRTMTGNWNGELMIVAADGRIMRGDRKKGVTQLKESHGPLFQQLTQLKSKMAEAAQHVYEDWEQDEEGNDLEYGAGGICSIIADEISEVIMSHCDDVSVTEGGQDGLDHAWVLVYNDTEAYDVDIPPSIYETGGGYVWKKKPGVEITANDIQIYPFDRKLITDDFYNESVTVNEVEASGYDKGLLNALGIQSPDEWDLAQDFHVKLSSYVGQTEYETDVKGYKEALKTVKRIMNRRAGNEDGSVIAITTPMTATKASMLADEPELHPYGPGRTYQMIVFYVQKFQDKWVRRRDFEKPFRKHTSKDIRFGEASPSDYDQNMLKAMGIKSPDNWDLDQEFTVVRGGLLSGNSKAKVHGYREALRLLKRNMTRKDNKEGMVMHITKPYLEPYSYTDEHGKKVNTFKKGEVTLYAVTLKNGQWQRARSQEAMYRQRRRGKNEALTKAILINRVRHIAESLKVKEAFDDDSLKKRQDALDATSQWKQHQLINKMRHRIEGTQPEKVEAPDTTFDTNDSEKIKELLRAEHGVIPWFAWPGGTPIVYVDEFGENLCANCVNNTDRDYAVLDYFGHEEGPSVICDDCNSEIKSAYGDPNEDDDED